MESLKRSMKYQFMESEAFIMKFWGIVLAVDVVFYFLSYIGGNSVSIGISVNSLGPGERVSLLGINLFIILITFIVYSYNRKYESFPLAISFSVTRKDYFLSFLGDNIFIALIFAIIQGILMKVDPFFIKLIGKVPLYDLLYFNTKIDNILFIILTLFIIFFAFIAFWNLIAALNYKFGKKIWIVAFVIFMIISYSNFETVIRLPEPIENIFTGKIGLVQYMIIFLGIGISYILNYLLVIKTNIKESLS